MEARMEGEGVFSIARNVDVDAMGVNRVSSAIE